MLGLYKFTLGPLLLLQARWVDRTTPRLPEAAGPRAGVVHGTGARRGAHGARAPLRVLFVGDSSAAGVGVDHQESALAAQAAAFLAQRTGLPVAWQLVAKSGVNTREAIALLAASEIRPADVLVTALGVNDVTTQRKPRQFIADYQALVGHVRRTAGARAVVVSGVPPLRRLPAAPQPLRWYSGKYAERLDRSLRQWIAQERSFGYVSLEWAQPHEMARDRYHPGPRQYRRWAQLIAESAARLLEDGGPDSQP